MKKKRIAVIAIGNELMGDDGIACAVLNALSKEKISQDVDLVDGGTGGISLIHMIRKYKKVIFIDSGDFGGNPGEIKIFTPEEAVSTKETMRYSLHEGDLLELIHLSKEIGEAPESVKIVAIQPKKIELNTTLSPELIDAIPEIVRDIKSLLEGF